MLIIIYKYIQEAYAGGSIYCGKEKKITKRERNNNSNLFYFNH